MSYKALYRAYRPASFTEVAGQKHIVMTLQNAIKQNKIAHAYLFCGPRGTGKTSIAKLLAKAVNCSNREEAPCLKCENCLAIQQGNHPDIVEIDAASNNGVDEIRDLIEKVKYAPIQGAYKVYIIDEVHMMSTGAFNALLKTLEEPPSHIIFILATTEAHKILPTIISRCQRFDFTKVPTLEIKAKLIEVLENEKVAYDEAALELVADLADGGMRDALSIIEQCVAYSGENVKIEDINEIYGITTAQEKIGLLEMIHEKNTQELMNKINTMMEKGIDIRRLTFELMEILKESIIYELARNCDLIKKINSEQAQALIGMFHIQKRFMFIEELIQTSDKYRGSTSSSSYLELCLLKLMTFDKDDVVQKPIQQMEQRKSTVSNATQPMIKNDHIAVAKDDKIETNVQNRFEKENKSEIIIDIANKSEQYSNDEILNLLVLAKKSERILLNEKWSEILNFSGSVAQERYLSWLKECEIVAVGENFLLLSTALTPVCNNLNDHLHEVELIRLFNQVLGKPKKVFAISKVAWMQIRTIFKQMIDEQRLPQPIPITLPSFEMKIEEEKNETEEKLKNLFGDGLFEVEE